MFRSKQNALGIFLSAFLFCGCNSAQSHVSELSANNDSSSNQGSLPDTISAAPPVETTPNPPVPGEVLESYSDDRHIGRRRRNKIEIDIVNNGQFRAYHPTNLAIIRFYSRGYARKWELRQTLEFDDDALAGADLQFADFNNDGFKDVTFVSGTAARGANEIRTLLIYDKSEDALVHVENSREYPNLEYNKTLNCIDSWMFHGATTTVFLKLERDRLREFARVNTGSEIVVDLIDQKGESKTILRKKMKEDHVYTRFWNFHPLKPHL
jgi:hypothetical protein